MTEENQTNPGNFMDDFLAAIENGTAIPMGESKREKWQRERQEELAVMLQGVGNKEHKPNPELAKLGADYRILLEDIKRNTPEKHWLGDILKVMFDRDVEAARRLIDKYYTKKVLFFSKRDPLLKEWMNRRLRESEYEGGVHQYIQMWKQVAVTAAILAISLDNLDSDEMNEIYFIFANALLFSGGDESLYGEIDNWLDQAIRRETRKQIENDLTDGATLDRKEINNINADDSTDKSVEERDPDQVLDWMKSTDPSSDFHGNNDEDDDYQDIDRDAVETDDKLLLTSLLTEVSDIDRKILLCPPGEMDKLATLLGRTANALYQRKNVLIKQLIKKTKLPPKIPHS